jgi:FMN phosphatase YigB (HAD superfamily)
MLATWSLDHAWIASVLDQARRVDTISLDIFDTALTRTLYSPTDVFAEIEQTLCAKGVDAAGFAHDRERAEWHARRNMAEDTRDVGYDHIYEALRRHTQLKQPIIDAAKILELDVEAKSLVAVPDLLELTRKLARVGKPYVFVSDMYLQEEVLAQQLERHGYDGWSQLYVSSAHNASKWTGDIWPIITAKHGRLLHIGDDEIADYASPLRAGQRAVRFVRCRSFRRSAPNVTPALLPLSRAQRKAEIVLRADPSAPPSPADQMRALGESFGAIVIGAFVRWLDQRVRQHHIDRLYFFSRDGWLLHEAWNVSGLWRGNPTFQYLYSARRPFNLAAGFLASSSEQIDEATLDFMISTSHGVTTQKALARLGLPDAILEEAQREFGNLDNKRLGSRTQKRLGDFLQRSAPSIHPILRQTYDETAAYLSQEDVFAGGRVGIVDIGWNGRLQRSLRKIGLAQTKDFQLAGFYGGLWPGALKNRYAAGPMEAAFTNEFESPASQYVLSSGRELLETLHTAPHGSVASFKHDGKAWGPIFLDSPDEMRQFDLYTQHFQSGVLHALEAIFSGREHLGLRLEDLTLENARAAISALILSPSPFELKALARLGHSGGFDHDGLVPILPVNANQRFNEQALSACEWKIGLLRLWASSAGKASRKRISGHARRTLPFVDERVLHQFGE